MRKDLGWILIVLAMLFYTTIIVIFLEMPLSGKIALFMAQNFIGFGIGILLSDEKEK